jgi:flagellar biosynthesis/type III secretory pathway protein FliH
MTHPPIPIIHLSGAPPAGTIISSTELAHYFDATGIIARAQEEARAIRQQARELLDHAVEESESLYRQAYERGMAAAAAETQEQITAYKFALADEIVQWLVDEIELEITIAQRMETSLRALVAQVLNEFIGEQDAAALIVQRVLRNLPRWFANHALTVRVAPDMASAVASALAPERQIHPHAVRVAADAGLSGRQAVLESNFVTLRLDLDTHLSALLSRLTRTEPLADEEPSAQALAPEENESTSTEETESFDDAEEAFGKDDDDMEEWFDETEMLER